MHREFIESLHCPFTGSKLSLKKVLNESDNRVLYGIVSSEAGDFPIVNGILRLLVDEYWEPIVTLVNQKKFDRALLTALEVPFYTRIGSAVNLLSRIAYRTGLDAVASGTISLKRRMYKEFTRKDATFVDTARHFKASGWVNGQVYRFSMKTFLPVYALLHAVNGDRGVLDFGCGLGQGAFLISRMYPETPITCVDYSFTSLYLAKKYFVSEGEFVCLDGNHPLPFDTGYFSTAYSSDALHCIDGKLNLSRELLRVSGNDGSVVLPHLHNAMSPIRFGKSLTPKGYSDLFDGKEKRVMPEGTVVRQFLCEDLLDLEREWSFDELGNDTSGVSIVVSQNSSIFRRYNGLWDKYIDSCMKNPVINPLYVTNSSNETVLLKKRMNIGEHWGGELLLNGTTYVPDTYRFPESHIDRDTVLSLKHARPQEFLDLATKFIVIEAPEHFS